MTVKCKGYHIAFFLKNQIKPVLMFTHVSKIPNISHELEALTSARVNKSLKNKPGQKPEKGFGFHWTQLTRQCSMFLNPCGPEKWVPSKYSIKWSHDLFYSAIHSWWWHLHSSSKDCVVLLLGEAKRVAFLNCISFLNLSQTLESLVGWL